MSGASTHHYNPDWLSDEDLLSGFAARLEEFSFLRDELARAPREGSTQHYLLVGVRGAGKTTMLKRLAVAIRRDADLHDHLIALSFPEELYQVKNLSDFWWAACEALADEFDRLDQPDRANRLVDVIDKRKRGGIVPDPLSEAGLTVLLQACNELGLRPVLLVDNLDMLFERIDKSGRKLKDVHSPAYWALRESLSTTNSPIVIGASVRLSEPFRDYDKAFYDFFIPKRLGKLSLAEVRQVLERLATAHKLPDVRERLQQRPSRIETLYELTGGNPRALGLIFELLRQGPNSRAVEDFERLMDITTPYYKARFEELSEQGQVVMHALAVGRPAEALRFGLTAAEIGSHAGLPTTTVSAQLDTQDREGLVEKNAAHGRTQYRIAEQLFRLWLQMRGSRRIRQNVLGLSRFLEALYSQEELHAGVQEQNGVSRMSDARYAFAAAGASDVGPVRHALEARGADHLLQYVKEQGGELEGILPADDLPEHLNALVRLREQLQKCRTPFNTDETDALLGSVKLRLDQKQSIVQAICGHPTEEELTRLRVKLSLERQDLLRYGMHEDDLGPLYHIRARGCLPMPFLTPQDAEAALIWAEDKSAFRSMVWRLLGTRRYVKIVDDATAGTWLEWGRKQAATAGPTEWANVAGTLRLSKHPSRAKEALGHAMSLGMTSRTWFDRGVLLAEMENDFVAAEAAYRKSIELDSTDGFPWIRLGQLLTQKFSRHGEAEAAYRKAIELDRADVDPRIHLAILLTDRLERYDEAEVVYREAIELDPADVEPRIYLANLLTDKLERHDEAEVVYREAIELEPSHFGPWNNFGIMLANKLNRLGEAEAAYRKAIELDPATPLPWNNLGHLLTGDTSRYEEAEAAYRKAIEIDPTYITAWLGLGILLTDKLNRHVEAEAAYRKAIEIDPTYVAAWLGLGILLTDKLNRHQEAETAYRKAIELDPTRAWPWNNLGVLLTDKLNRDNEAEAAYRKAIELDAMLALPHYNLGRLLEKQSLLEQASIAYAKGWGLDGNPDPFWRTLRANLQTRLCATAARYALEANDPPALRQTLASLLAESVDIATSLASEYFVEEFLAPVLAQAKQATVVLEQLRSLDFARHARPLLLACEVVVANRADMLAELEPELQNAVWHMFQRLTKGKAGRG